MIVDEEDHHHHHLGTDADEPIAASSVLDWERNYGRVWDDEMDAREYKHLRLSQQDANSTMPVQRGMLRYVVVVLDTSKSAAQTDLKPTRLGAMVLTLRRFLDDFHDENPLSNLGLVMTQGGGAVKISELSRSAAAHHQALDKLEKDTCQGDVSVMNSLRVAVAMLKNAPSFATREVIFVCAALSSVDPADVYLTLEEVAAAKIRVSVAHLCAQVELHRRLAERTGGKSGVALNVAHLGELLAEHLRPPVATGPPLAALVKMGFPSQRLSDDDPALVAHPAFCSDTNDFCPAPFFCPRCRAAISTYPATCRTCLLPLVAASNLARSYHHLLPVPPFAPLDADNSPPSCAGCLGAPPQWSCPKCHAAFCPSCDALVHDTLFFCPCCFCD